MPIPAALSSFYTRIPLLNIHGSKVQSEYNFETINCTIVFHFVGHTLGMHKPAHTTYSCARYNAGRCLAPTSYVFGAYMVIIIANAIYEIAHPDYTYISQWTTYLSIASL